MTSTTGPLPSLSTDPLTEKVKQRLIKKGVVNPTPKIIHTVRKKELQKSLRKSKKLNPIEPLTEAQEATLAQEFYYKNVCQEYKQFSKAVDGKVKGVSALVGRPWEGLGREKMRELVSGERVESRKLKSEYLKELGMLFHERKIESLEMFLDDDDVEVEEGMLNVGEMPVKRSVSDNRAIKILVNRLTAREITRKDWKFVRIMKQSELQFTETQMLKILAGLNEKRCWKQATEVVEWVYSRREHLHLKSRFVYTKLLDVVGKAIRPQEALRVFKKMRGDYFIYPDMAAYHCIAVTLGQSGMVRELISVIESMKEKTPQTAKNGHRKRNWDPSLQPDVVVFNSVLNACVSSHQWKGVSWVFQQLRKYGLKPNGATYGLAMEVMLNSGKYDLVHEIFQKMKRKGEALNSLTYKVLVKTLREEGKVEEAIQIVRDMEHRGIIGSASVYYELACFLCNKGRWEDGMKEIRKLKGLRLSKPLQYSFTGMILSSLEGGYMEDCVSIFEHMQDHCAPDIGTVNAMLKVYTYSDRFLDAKELFEKLKGSMSRPAACWDNGTPLVADIYTYGSMLEVSGNAHQWEYFEYVYKEMHLDGYKLDQRKYTKLLVEASRYGKHHLLEHAFDTTLEAGDIPDPAIFTGMVCQCMVRHDYEKAATIAGAMAHAPFLLRKGDWTDLFKRNKRWISNDNLKRLSETISQRGMPEDTTTVELLKALDAMCKYVPYGDASTESTSSGTYLHTTGGFGDAYGVQSSDIEVSEIGPTGGQKQADKHLNYGIISVGQIDDGNCEDDLHVLGPYSTFDESADSSDEEFQAADPQTEDGFDDKKPPDLRHSQVGYVDRDEPSAHEILRSWKESRTKGRRM